MIFIFLGAMFLNCQVPGATFSMCGLQNAKPSHTLVIFEGILTFEFKHIFEESVAEKLQNSCEIESN